MVVMCTFTFFLICTHVLVGVTCLNKGFDFAFICVSAELGMFSTGKQTIPVQFTVENIFFHICFLLAFFPFISSASRGFALLVSVSRFKIGAPNSGFPRNTFKTLFRLSRVLLRLQKCILSGAVKFVSVRSP